MTATPEAKILIFRVDSDHADKFVLLKWTILGADTYQGDRLCVTIEAPNLWPDFPCLEEGCDEILDESHFVALGGKCFDHCESVC